jgi:hypothetical protein
MDGLWHSATMKQRVLVSGFGSTDIRRLQLSALVNFFVMHLLLDDASAAEFERLFVVALVSNVRSG